MTAIFPSNTDDLSNEFLTRVFQPLQPGIEVTQFDIVNRADCGDGFASTADRIILKLDYAGRVPADLPTQVMLKTMLLSPHAPAEMYENEVRFYRDIRPHLDIETPRIFAADFDKASGQFGLIMEDLSLRQVRFPNATQKVSVESVKGILQTLATLHGSFWNSPRLESDLNWIATPLKGGMSDIFQTIGLDLIKDQVEKNPFKQELIAPIGLSLDEMWQQLQDFQHYTATLPQTLLHGDTHVANTYLCGDNDEIGGLFDWQLIVRGNWAHDVSYIIVTALSTEQRQQHQEALIQFYLDCLSTMIGEKAPGFDQAWQLYRKSIIWGLVIGWLITPPANYGVEITRANTSKLVNAVTDLRSFEV